MQKGESNIMKKTARLFILAMILLTLITPMQTSAKSSKTVYYDTMYWGKGYKTATSPKLRKIIFKKNKIFQARLFYLLLITSLVYLVTNFIFDFTSI